MKDRTTANPIDSNAVNEVRLSGLLAGANRSSEEAERVGLYIRKSQPSDVDPNAVGLARWHEAYGDLRKLKFAFEKEHDR
jgi:hypothetical protein